MFKAPTVKVSQGRFYRGGKSGKTEQMQTQLRPGQQKLSARFGSRILLLPPSGCSSGVESSSSPNNVTPSGFCSYPYPIPSPHICCVGHANWPSSRCCCCCFWIPPNKKGNARICMFVCMSRLRFMLIKVQLFF